MQSRVQSNAPAADDARSVPPRDAKRLLVPVALVVIFMAAALPLIIRGTLMGRWGEDQIRFHEPAIRLFAQQIPAPDLTDYRSATTPGYHLFIAGVSKVVGESRAALQLIGALFTIGLLGLLGYAAGSTRHAGASGFVIPFAATLPVVCSMYVFQPGVWLLPDNAGWLALLLVMVLTIQRRLTAVSLAVVGAALVGVVLVRQIHVWSAGLVWAAAWLSVPMDERSEGHPLSIRPVLTTFGSRLRAASAGVIATLPALALLGYFYKLWGGLTPPMFQGQYHTLNPAAPAFILSVFGVASCFYGGFLYPALWTCIARWRLMLTTAAVIGAGVAVVVPTSFSQADGRWTGLWILATKLPLIAGRTAPAIVLLSTLGAVMLTALAVSLRWRERWILLASVVGFVVAQAASFELWQRYTEPFILIVLAIYTPRFTSGNESLAWRVRAAGPVVLAVLLAVLAFVTMSKAPPAVIWEFDPANPRATP